MRTLILAIALATMQGLAAAAPASVASEPVPGFEAPVLTAQLDGTVVIDPEGNVREYAITRTRRAWPAAITDRLQSVVTAWRFEPVKVGGVAVQAKSRMRITLLAHEREDGYAISIDNVTFPETPGALRVDHRAAAAKVEITRQPEIDYPPALLMRGMGGAVLVSIRIAQDGNVADAAIVQSSLFGARGTPEEFRINAARLEAEVLQGIRVMRFNITGTLQNGEQVGLLPIVFMLDDTDREPPHNGYWRVERRSVKRIPPWVSAADGARMAGVSDIGAGDALDTLDGGLRLKHAVSGIAL